jgi:signal transduction histidine kinase
MSTRSHGYVAILLAGLLVVISGAALAAAGATKEEAVAMVKKAVAAIKAEGTEKVYAEISDPQGAFVDRDLYVVVYRMDGLVLAHGADKSRIGVNLIHDKDVDGKEFVSASISPRPSRLSGKATSS